MKTAFHASGVALLLAAFINDVQAQGFLNDNDGLLDVGEAAGFPDDPTGATGELLLTSRGIQDLDGTSLLTNLQTLDLGYNAITSVEPGAFKGLTNLETLLLFGNDLSELNLTSATFDHLERSQPPDPWIGFPGAGFLADSSEITLLVLDDAQLSRGSFDAIVEQTTRIVDASLVGLTFTDGNPSNVNALLGIPTLDDVWVDPSLYSLYAAEFDTFAATAGNTLTIVPEPTTCTLALVSLCLAMSGRRIAAR